MRVRLRGADLIKCTTGVQSCTTTSKTKIVHNSTHYAHVMQVCIVSVCVLNYATGSVILNATVRYSPQRAQSTHLGARLQDLLIYIGKQF